MPYRRLLDSQIEDVRRLLGVGKPLALADRCGVLGEGPLVAYGAVVKIFDDGYGVLLDGTSHWRRFDAARVRPERSDRPFAQIAAEAGVGAATVTQHANMHGIKPPRDQGRPPGPGQQRSPYRARAKELKAEGKSLQEIADQIMKEVRAKAKTPKERAFKISRSAIGQLLDEKPKDNPER